MQCMSSSAVHCHTKRTTKVQHTENNAKNAKNYDPHTVQMVTQNLIQSVSFYELLCFFAFTLVDSFLNDSIFHFILSNAAYIVEALLLYVSKVYNIDQLENRKHPH